MARPPSLTSLRLFLHVAGTRSFSETARAANLSQPALSRTIKLLEEDLRVRLRSDSFTRLASLIDDATKPPVVEFELPNGKRGLEFAEEIRRRRS